MVAEYMTQPVPERLQALLSDSRIQAELQAIHDREPETIRTQVELTEISSPTFAEGARAASFAGRLAAAGVQDVHIDEQGNVLGWIGPKVPGLLLTAHLDTVFDADTDVSVHQDEHGIYHGAGIVDDDRGLAAVLAVAPSLVKVQDLLTHGILIGANVREEGKGDLGGARYLLEHERERFRSFITVDGSDPDRIVTIGPACASFIVRFTGPGGHAYGNFGRPSAVHAAARATLAITSLDVPENPKTIWNVGAIRGGVTETSIAYAAQIEVDLRSNEQAVLDDLVVRFREAVQTAVAEENAARDTSAGEITVVMEQTCAIPGGTLPAESILGVAAVSALQALGVPAYLGGAATTDANIPLSVGVPALCLGGGGHGENEHSTEEIFDPTDSHLGPQGIFLTALVQDGED